MRNKKSTKKLAKNIISLAIVFVMMTAIAIHRNGMHFGHRLTENDTDSITGIERLEDGSIIVNTTQLGLDIRGYNGHVPLEIRLDPSGKVASMAVLDNSESPEFLQHVLDGGLLEQWIGRDARQILAAPDADAVSGATYTSKAIIANVRAGLATALGRPNEIAKATTHGVKTSDTKPAVERRNADNSRNITAPSHNTSAKKSDTSTAAHTPKPNNASPTPAKNASNAPQTANTAETTEINPHKFIVNTTETGKDIHGYAGPVPIRMAVSAKGRIISITALPNDETPGFFKRVTRAALTDTFVGMSIRQALASDMPDAVSGATYSSKALIANMRQAFEQARDTLASFHKSTSKATAATTDKQTKHTAEQSQQATSESNATSVNSVAATAPQTDSVAEPAKPTKGTEQANTPEATQCRSIDSTQDTAPSPWTWQLIVALCLAVSATVIPLLRNGRKYRTIILALNVAGLGLLCGKFISFSLMINIMSSGLQWPAGLLALIMLFAAFVMPLLGRPNHYCMWICPYGSAQELMGHIRKRKWRPSPRLARILTWTRRGLWVILMVLMWCEIAFTWTDYEPFAIFVPAAASVAVIIIASVFLILSIFVNRPYCAWICPTGTTFRAAQDITKP